jgi:hypothetical protein
VQPYVLAALHEAERGCDATQWADEARGRACAFAVAAHLCVHAETAAGGFGRGGRRGRARASPGSSGRPPPAPRSQPQRRPRSPRAALTFPSDRAPAAAKGMLSELSLALCGARPDEAGGAVSFMDLPDRPKQLLSDKQRRREDERREALLAAGGGGGAPGGARSLGQRVAGPGRGST